MERLLGSKEKFCRRIGNLFVLFAFLTVILTGCALKNSDEYRDVISKLSEDEYYAFVELQDNTYPVLLVADGVYEFDEKIQAAIFVTIYYVIDGEILSVGEIQSGGTAYPISSKEDGIYTAGHHNIVRYTIDDKTGELIAAEYAAEEFSEDADDASYYYTSQGVTEQVKDRAQMDIMFEQYEKAEVINFVKRD